MAQVYKVQVNELEKNLTIRALVEFRNQMIENMKDHTMMNDLIIKFIDAQQVKGYRKYAEKSQR